MIKSDQVGLSVHDAVMEYSQSKMSVIEESGNNVRNHYIIKLVEFFEFIARSAAQKYGGPENINKKIEDLLDIILPMFN